MLTPWADFDTLFRRLDGGFPGGFLLAPPAADPRPRAVWTDQGDRLEAVFEVPGFAEKDLKVDVRGDLVSVRGERAVAPPEGFRPQRQERGTLAFQRSYTLDVPIAADGVTATLKDGVLTVVLPKQAEVRPRSIPVTVATA